MTRKSDDKSKSKGATGKDARGGLRLIKNEPAPVAGDVAPTATDATTPRAGRSLIGFMNAWADAIDRDVKLILDL